MVNNTITFIMEFYKEKIIPNMIKHMNNIIKKITNSEDIKIDGEITYNKNKIDIIDINWYIIT